MVVVYLNQWHFCPNYGFGGKFEKVIVLVVDEAISHLKVQRLRDNKFLGVIFGKIYGLSYIHIILLTMYS